MITEFWQGAEEFREKRNPDLTMRAWINGELLGEDSLANCAFTFDELISFASRGSAVAPGDPGPVPAVPVARRGQPRGPRH